MISAGTLLERRWYARDALEVGPALLGKVLVVGERAVRIVEAEAYRGADDPASHGWRGPTPRTEVMFGPPGHLYVYFSYGMHWCANVVCGEAGECMAVLLRAGSPLAGIEAMRGSRPRARRDVDLCSGPAKLTQALGIDGDDDGADLTDPGGRVRLFDDGYRDADVRASPRVGISRAVRRPWRWYLAGDPNVSRAR